MYALIESNAGANVVIPGSKYAMNSALTNARPYHIAGLPSVCVIVMCNRTSA